MSARNTWIWICVAGALFAFIFFYERTLQRPPPGPLPILPNLKPKLVNSVQVRPSGRIQLDIVAERSNQVWQLTEPLRYPAEAARVDGLLSALEHLVPAAYISSVEMRGRPKADEEYGFTSPQASIRIQQGDYHAHLLVGARTAPGDQVFFQVVGLEGAYVVDADLLKLLPASANDWRDTTVVNLDGLAFDRIAVTNNTKVFVLQRDLTNQLWRMVWPFTKGVRADVLRIEEGLTKLQALRVLSFLPEEPKPDLSTLGLAPPELELAFGEGTNTQVWLQFGRSPTNDAARVYARRVGQSALFTVASDLQALWRTASINDFRDPHLLTLADPVEAIEVRGLDAFSITRRTNDAWIVSPGNFAADSAVVKDCLATLTSLQIVDFIKDVVNPPDLPDYGLATPLAEYLLHAVGTNAAARGTTQSTAELHFGVGTNQSDKVFANRAGDSSVYAVKAGEFARLPLASWQFREHRLWHFSGNEVASLTIRQQGKQHRIIRNAAYKWSIAPGSQGLIRNELAVEETVRGLVQVSAAAWLGYGPELRKQCGFTTDGYQITLELKNGDKHTIEFGGRGANDFPYAAVTFDGVEWVLEFPWTLFRDLQTYLSIPPSL